MKTPRRLLFRLQGTIMVFALVVILVGTLVLAGWAQMMATAALHPSSVAEGVKNRIALENGQALARQYLLVSLPSGATLSNAPWQASISNGAWGGCSVNNAASFWTSVTNVEGNPFSPFGGFSFLKTDLVSISNNFQTNTWKYSIKSRSPLFIGFPAVLHFPVNTGASSFNWITNKTVIYWTDVMTNRPNSAEMVAFPFTSGTNATNANAYTGTFAAPLSTFGADTNIASSYITYTNYYTNSAVQYSNSSSPNYPGVGTNYNYYYSGGRVDVLIDTPQTEPVIRHSDIPNTMPGEYRTTNYQNVGGGVTNTIIRRYTSMQVTNMSLAASALTNALHIVLTNGNTNLSTITLTNTNNARQIYLNVQRSSTNLQIRTATTTNSYVWKLAISSTTPLNMTNLPSGSGRSLTLVGGIRTDQLVTTNGTLKITADTNSSAEAEAIADRILWIEGGLNR